MRMNIIIKKAVVIIMLLISSTSFAQQSELIKYWAMIKTTDCSGNRVPETNWDADFRFGEQGWDHWSFRGSRWQRIKKAERQMYQKNAYRVLLTRARQGMVLVVPT